jgi:2'-hydroxyisoflavone reductase
MFIDARDLSEWYIRLLEQGVRGSYMGLGPAEPLDFRGLLDGIQEGIGSDATFTWVATEFLQQRRVRPYTDMPLWMPTTETNHGFNRFDLSRIAATGITYRPLTVTASETLEWHHTRPEANQARLRMGLTAEREAALLQEWHDRG